jgi:hypothetical protein
MKTLLTEEIRAAGKARLDELDGRDITTLTQFAEYKLVVVGLPASFGEDLAAQALAFCVRGLESDQAQSRRPHLENLESKQSLLAWLRGVIASLVESMSSQRQYRAEHLAWDEALGVEQTEPTPAQAAEVSDLQRALFARLRERSPQMHQSTIDAWDQVFTGTAYVPDVNGRRKYVHIVRKLAREVVTELGGIR